MLLSSRTRAVSIYRHIGDWRHVLKPVSCEESDACRLGVVGSNLRGGEKKPKSD